MSFMRSAALTVLASAAMLAACGESRGPDGPAPTSERGPNEPPESDAARPGDPVPDAEPIRGTVDRSRVVSRCGDRFACAQGAVCVDFSAVDPSLEGGSCIPGDVFPCSMVTCPVGTRCAVGLSEPLQVWCAGRPGG